MVAFAYTNKEISLKCVKMRMTYAKSSDRAVSEGFFFPNVAICKSLPGFKCQECQSQIVICNFYMFHNRLM